MKKLMYKELYLAASPLTYLFVAGAFIAFLPGYPILLGAFFTTLGIFYSFQSMRENNDISYSLLLPVSKADVVGAKFAFTVFIQLISFAIMAAITLIRMTALKNAAPYKTNPLMTANLVFLGFALLIFGLFNFCFVRGFFRTAYYFGKPFIIYIVISCIVITAAESLHHFPGMEALNSFGFQNFTVQLLCLFAGMTAFSVLTFCGVKGAIKSFDGIDL